MVFLLLLPATLLFADPDTSAIAKALLLYAVLSVVLWALRKKPERRLRHAWAAGVLALLGGFGFYHNWCHSSKAMAVAGMLHLPFSLFIIAVSAVLALCSVPGIDYLITFIDGLLGKVMNTGTSTPLEEKRPLSRKQIGFLALAAILTVTVCSTSSPLYAINTWNDANIYFSIGKSMLKGMLPYRDLFDHKGPLLYALHALTALISFDSFLGVYLLEVVCCFFTLLYAFKLLRLFCPDDILLLIPLLGAAVCTSTAFWLGDSAEELCMPLLVYAGYVGAKALRENTLPSHREFFLLGLTSACVLWIKFTMLGYYLGWIVAPACLALSQKRFGELMKKLGVLILGIFTATAPFLLYFGWNHAIGDWFEVYFYDNLFVYSNAESANGLLPNALAGLWEIRSLFPLGAAALVLGGVWCWYRCSRWIFVSHLATCVGLLLTVFGGGRYYPYYSLAFGACAVFGIAGLYETGVFCLSWWKASARKRGWAAAALLLCFALLLADSPNISRMKYPKSEYPQFQVKAAMEASGVENPTLLNYGFLDGGFYTVTGIYPRTRFFCKVNLPLSDITQEQNQYIEDSLVDFVIAPHPLDISNYHLLDVYLDLDKFTDYYLYQKIT